MTSATLNWLPLAALVLILGGCAALPNGPSVMVYPGTDKNFDQFRSNDMTCRQYALEYVGGDSPEQTGARSGIASVVTGTAVGAAAGALLGGNEGAAIGAGTGLLVGTLAGSGTAQTSAYYTQQQYDNAYIQCMYASGHRVPVSGQINAGAWLGTGKTWPPSAPATIPPPPPGYAIPPPPPGPPPPPPPGT